MGTSGIDGTPYAIAIQFTMRSADVSVYIINVHIYIYIYYLPYTNYFSMTENQRFLSLRKPRKSAAMDQLDFTLGTFANPFIPQNEKDMTYTTIPPIQGFVHE